MKWIHLFALLCVQFCLAANNIHPKEFNKKYSSLQKELHLLYEKSFSLKKEKDFLALKNKIQKVKEELHDLRSQAKATSLQNVNEQEDIWDLGEVTLSQLLMEFGSSDYVYIIPNDLGSIKLHIYSALSIPRGSWDEMIRLILDQNGIGMKKINTFARQLFSLKQETNQVDTFIESKDYLKICPEEYRIGYLLKCKPEDGKSLQSFFEKFSNPKNTSIHLIGNRVILVSQKRTIEKLLKLYELAWSDGQNRVVKILPLTKISPEEAQKIIENFFEPKNLRIRPTLYPQHQDHLFCTILSQGIVLVGSHEAVKRAEKIIKDLEKQIVDPSEMITYWYTCKHSDPEELAKVLEKVYATLIQIPEKTKKPNLTRNTHHRYQQNPNLPIQPKKVEPGVLPQKKTAQFGNFIVDPKTTSILMVVEKEKLFQLKKVIEKLDVPKKMVQIEVLLVEKRIHDRNESGINLLKIGTASEKKETAIRYDTSSKAVGKGVLDFILSKPKGNFPAYDFSFKLLMAQEDIRINANPSIVTVNQTPATISIVEELSINNGAVQLNGSNGVAVEKSFSRAQYGITIVMTPTVHEMDNEALESGDKASVTLQTNINFDTAQSSEDDRPPVTRRHIENEVRVKNGETIIIGGLKRLSAEERREKIPFLGDIPGIGKMFGSTKQTNSNTEMFIFITPKILSESTEELKKYRKKELEKRPGDLPEFLERIEASKNNQQKKIFEDSLKLIFDTVA